MTEPGSVRYSGGLNGIPARKGLCGPGPPAPGGKTGDRHVSLTSTRQLLTAVLAVVTLCPAAHAADDAKGIAADLRAGLPLQQVAGRAYARADGEGAAAAAVRQIFAAADTPDGAIDPAARDIVAVAGAVIAAWPGCRDTYAAVQAAVEQAPDRAADIVAGVVGGGGCNCTGGEAWLDRGIADKIRIERRVPPLEAPLQCACSRFAIHAAVAALTEAAGGPQSPPEADPADRLAGQIAGITEQTAAVQSLNGWECDCTGANIAAGMQAIADEDLRRQTYAELPELFAGTGSAAPQSAGAPIAHDDVYLADSRGVPSHRVAAVVNGRDGPVDLGREQYLLAVYDGPAGSAAGPREAIALDGTLAPGATLTVASSAADDAIKEDADLVTGQFDAAPGDAVVLERLGGDGARYCRAQALAFTLDYAEPLRKIRFRRSRPLGEPGLLEVASPN